MPNQNHRSALLLHFGIFILFSIGAYFYLPAYNWVYILLLSSVLVWVPLSISSLGDQYQLIQKIDGPVKIAGLLLALALVIPFPLYAFILALPWLILALVTFFMLIVQMRQQKQWNPFFLAAAIFWITGAAWATAVSAHYQPFGFSTIIVLLTAAHFHFAGFMLMYICAFFTSCIPSRTTALFGGIAMLAIPLTAVGITLTHYIQQVIFESFSGAIMAIGGGGIAVMAIQWGRRKKSDYWYVLGGSCLLAGMVLAFLYAMRPLIPIGWLDIPFMYATHGTLNALGLGILVTKISID